MDDQRLDTWHEGERALQSSVGVELRLREMGPHIIRDFMPDQHRLFFNALKFAVVGSVDDDWNPWAGIFVRDRDLLTTPNQNTLRVQIDEDQRDPCQRGMSVDRAIAVLGIDLATRRRNRANGLITHFVRGSLSIKVQQSFGNCPQYIVPRNLLVRPRLGVVDVDTSEHLNDAMRTHIQRADTFFVASYVVREDGSTQVDVSHRGGPQGFVTIGEDGDLQIPDYPGNNYFNTLGNILVTGRAGLLFVDFSTGDTLQLTGIAKLLSGDKIVNPHPRAERYWCVQPTQVVWRANAVALFERDALTT